MIGNCKWMLISVCLSTHAATILAQPLTIPEAVARAGTSLHGGPSVPSGPAPTFDSILAETDMVVRGFIGKSRSYLSDDERDVYTDYSILSPAILYQAVVTTLKRPEMPTVTVTIHGGRVMVGSLTYTSSHDALPRLEAGSEYLLLLKQVGDRYEPAGVYYGVFQVSDGALKASVKKQGFAPEWHGAGATRGAQDMVARLLAIRETSR